MDEKELKEFLFKTLNVINDEIDNIADDELVGLLEDLVLDIEGAYNYIRFNFKE